MNQESRVKSQIKTNGFTVIEILVVISVMGILTVLGITSFSRYNDAQIVLSAAHDVESVLNQAKSRALSQVKETPPCNNSALIKYEVQMVLVPPPANKYRLRIHCALGDTDIYERILPRDITFKSGTTPSFSFPILTGGVAAAGQVVIGPAVGPTKRIVVDSFGGIKIQ